MTTKRLIGSVLLMSAMFVTGCGVSEGDAEASSELATREDEVVVWCTNKFWKVNFYSEPEHINLVGWLRCDCFSPQTRWGVLEGYQALEYDEMCDIH